MEMTGKYLQGFANRRRNWLYYLEPKPYCILQYLDHIKTLLTNPGPLD